MGHFLAEFLWIISRPAQQWATGGLQDRAHCSDQGSTYLLIMAGLSPLSSLLSASLLTLSPATNPPISDCTNKVSTPGEISTSAGFWHPRQSPLLPPPSSSSHPCMEFFSFELGIINQVNWVSTKLGVKVVSLSFLAEEFYYKNRLIITECFMLSKQFWILQIKRLRKWFPLTYGCSKQ